MGPGGSGGKGASYCGTGLPPWRLHRRPRGRIAEGRSAKYFPAMQLPFPSAHRFPLILAPMAGVSEAPYRQVCRAMGADVVLSEFLSSEAIRRRIRTTLEGAEFEPVERPIGIQIYGADPTAMAEAARLITEHYRPEFIDINFGCPVKKVVQRNGGSGCLRDLDLVDRIIRAVIGATHLPGDGQDPERLERAVARRGRHRPADAGRRRARVHAPRAHPDPDVLGPCRLGRDRAGGRGARHSGASATATSPPPPTSCGCAITPAAPA